jgi:hypothetical protein
VIVGGILAFSSMRKQPAAVTTVLVCLLFALFAYNNLDAMYDTTVQRFATMDAIKNFDKEAATNAVPNHIRTSLEPTLTPATYNRVRTVHITSDVLTILALCAMEVRRRRLHGTAAT